MPIIASDNFKLSYSIQGNGTPAIVIGSAIYYPRTFSTNLRSQLQLIFMDHRGFGTTDSTFDNNAFSLEKLIDDIEKLRQHLNLDKIVVVGHSGHAFIALEYAKKYSRHVSHTVLIASSPFAGSSVHAAADRYFEEHASAARKVKYQQSMQYLKDDIQHDPANTFIHYSLRSAPRIWYNDEFDATYLWQEVNVIPEMFDHVWGAVFNELDITKNLSSLTTPVLLALGKHDYWNPPHLWDAYRLQFKNITIKLFDESGHTPQLEEAEKFDAELINWLNSQK